MESLLHSSCNQSNNPLFLDSEERICEERNNKDAGKVRKRKAAKTCKSEHHRKNAGNDPLKKKNITEENCYSLKSNTPCFTVSNIPKDLVYVDVKKYIEYYCGPFHNLRMLKDVCANFIGVIELTFDDCVQAAKQLEGKEIAGNLLSITVTGVDSDSDDETRSNDIEPPMKKKQAHSRRGVKPDVWAKDPKGLYGLEPTFLQSLGIAPPLQQWVHVSNFRCDRLELKEVFDLAGQVLVCSVNMLTEKYAMIMYSHPLEAVQAISMLNGQKLYGNALKISMCKPPPNSSLLPKSLSNIGPGLGIEDRPLKDIVQQYERFLCGRSNVLNPIFFSKPVNIEKEGSNINETPIVSTDSEDRPTVKSEPSTLKDIVQQYERFLCGRSNVLNPIFFSKPVNIEKEGSNINETPIVSTDSEDRPTVKNEPSTGVKTEIVDDTEPMKSEDETPSDYSKSDSVGEAKEAIKKIVKSGVAPEDFVSVLKTLLSQSVAQMIDDAKHKVVEYAASSESAGSNASGNKWTHPNVCFSPTKSTTTPTYIQTPTATVDAPERNIPADSSVPRNAVLAVRPPNAPVFRPRSTLQHHPNIHHPQRIAGVGTVPGVEARSNASVGFMDAPIPHPGPANNNPRHSNVFPNFGPGFHNNPGPPPFNRNTMLTTLEQPCTLQIVNVPSSTTTNDLYEKLQKSPDIMSINFNAPGSVLVQFSNRPVAEFYFRILFHVLVNYTKRYYLAAFLR